jgi:hypothetical protein
MRSRLIVACSLALALGGDLGAGQNAEPAALEVLARLDSYFESYHVALGQLVADERLVQNVARGTGSGVNAIRLTREIRSEVAFLDLPGGAGWLGFRDVQRVSGKNVRAPGPSLAEVLVRSGADNYQQARALLLAGARHNLGEPRTTNLPTLPLELLHQRHRWRYDIRLEAYERVEGRRTARVFLEERSTPSLVRRGDGGDLMARVVGWVEPDSGQLWRAEVRFEDPRIIFAERHAPTVVLVHFKANGPNGLIVPDRMEERFFDSVHGIGDGESRYRNYRRFETAARVLPPPAL